MANGLCDPVDYDTNCSCRACHDFRKAHGLKQGDPFDATSFQNWLNTGGPLWGVPYRVVAPAAAGGAGSVNPQSAGGQVNTPTFIISAVEEQYYQKLPPGWDDSMRLYVETGRMANRLGLMILANKLVDALVAAGDWKFPLSSFAEWLYHACPPEAWGSDEKVNAWIRQGGLRGLNVRR